MPGREPALFARDRAAWRAWLTEHHATAAVVHLVFLRKSTGEACLSYDEAVEEALCFGWIDGLKRKLDDRRYTYRFTPRRPGSAWSATNKRRVERLTAEGRMRAAGRRAVAEARRSGAWRNPARVTVQRRMPAELAAALRRSPAARRAYEALAPGRQGLYRRWIAEAKRVQTRDTRAARAVERLAAGGRDPWEP